MLAHSLLSGALLLLPIAITVGVYIGIEFQEIFHSGFKGTYGVLVPAGGGPSDSDGVQTTMYCQKTIGITPKGGLYTYNPNQWALGANDASGACMNVTTGTITSGSILADPWAVTWNYSQGPETQPVHAFPNALLDVSTLPIKLSVLSKVAIDVSWTYALGNSNKTNTASADLVAADFNANVALDMFLDPSKSDSKVTTKAAHEVMIWLGMFGVATQPIGLDVGAVATMTVNETAFNLYAGSNSAGQKVFTWVATTTAYRFVGDISPMLTELATHGGPTSADYLGYVAFGSEAYSSPQNVTLSVPELSIDIQ